MRRSFSVRTFWDIPVTDFSSSPNLFVPVLRSLSMRTTHLSLIRSSVVSTGHGGRSVSMKMGTACMYYLCVKGLTDASVLSLNNERCVYLLGMDACAQRFT